MNVRLRSMLSLLAALCIPLESAHAVPPPDFIFNIGSQLAQTFSIVCVCVSAFCSVGYRQVLLALQGRKRLAIAAVGLIVVLLSIILTFGIEVAWR